ncbi:MAG: metallophosphoesterase [Chitinophagaceae bacterium]
MIATYKQKINWYAAGILFFALYTPFHSSFIEKNYPVAINDTAQKFTIIIVPDTQFYSEITAGGGSSATGGTIAMFNAQTEWIAVNRATRNIVYVGQLGDCVQNGDNPPIMQKNEEWIKASKALAILESPSATGLQQGIPFGISVGNHDQTPSNDPTGTTAFYNQYFGIDHFKGKDYYGGHHGSNNDIHYQLFSAGGVDFLVISLEYDQTPGFSTAGGALDWTESLIKKYDKRKVMLMTHHGIAEKGDPQPAFSTQGQAIYERLKQYPNFILFLCGHICNPTGEAKRIDTFNGNKVITLLSDYQCRPGGGNGLLRIMEFDPANNKIAVKTYSPFAGAYEVDENSQFELDVNLTKQ